MPGQPTAGRLAGPEGWRTPCERQRRWPLAALWAGQGKRPARRAWPRADSAVISLATGPPVPATPAAGPALRLAGSERVMALCLSLHTVGDFPRSGRGPIKGYGAFRKTSVSLCGNLNRAAIANHFREHYAAC